MYGYFGHEINTLYEIRQLKSKTTYQMASVEQNLVKWGSSQIHVSVRVLM